MSQPANPLVTFSEGLANAVSQASPSIVTVQARQRWAASGVHWQPGVIVTADHTLRRDQDIAVTLPDGQSVSATLVGRDPSNDLAVLRIPTTDFPTAQRATSPLQVGHLVLALGRAKGISASLGVVSSLGGGRVQDPFLRLDLTIYPGFSGGPVIDAESCVVALTTVGPRSLVLGIPTATVERVTQQLLATGRIARGYLGIGMQPVRLSERLRPLANAELAVILVAVEAEGPAEQAGLLLGDILITLAGVTIRDTGDVQAVLGSAAVGQTIPVRVIRGGQLLELALTIGERRGERE